MTITISSVVSGGFCIGCGVCAVKSDAIRIDWNSFGDKVARIIRPLDEQTEIAISNVCPFSAAANETKIAEIIFPEIIYSDSNVGRYISAYIGYSEAFRTFGSSGGVITHILAKLLRDGLVDAVLCVGPTDSCIAEYQVVVDEIGLKNCATSFYYPVSMEAVIEFVRKTPGRYAITGIPCFHKALRLLRATDTLINERIVFQAGIVCGQMKSAEYAEYLARRCGKNSASDVTRAKFRVKNSTTSADNYRFQAEWVVENQRHLSGSILAKDIGVNWAMSYFKPKACDYCDDVFAEVADFVAMDAWLPGHVSDPLGTSILMIRNHEVEELINADIKSGALALDVCSADVIVQSQEAGLRHRREGVRVRLAFNRIFGNKMPKKRVSSSFQSGLFICIEMLLRVMLRRTSRGAFYLQRKVGNGLWLFNALMYGPHFLYRLFSAIKRRHNSSPSRKAESAYRLD